MTTAIPNAAQPGPTWTKSTYSSDGGNFIEAPHGITDATPVHDSKNPTGPAIWPAGLHGVGPPAGFRAGHRISLHPPDQRERTPQP
ncbi:DUF397 domain-containing protein [Streptomyces sp. NPDC050485]|uniref:DUF397 domain-containing protein n=1 Tax=Streptomyces sp. NPDC050485 TaxID=3365617 RepID=UPI003788F90B